MARKARLINLSEKQKQIITKLSSGTHTPLNIKIRATIILDAYTGFTNIAVASKLEVTKTTVNLWRKKWSVCWPEIQKIEEERVHKLKQIIIQTLSDIKRSGKPPTFTQEQIAQMIAIGCKKPEDFDLPLSHWTFSELRKKIIERNIVERISERHLARIFKNKGFKTPQI